MKYFLTIFSFLTFSFLAQAQSEEDYHSFHNQERWAQNLLDVQGDTQARGFDVTHAGLDIEVDPAVKHIGGSVKISFKVTQDNLDTVKLDLVDALLVSKVKYNGNDISYVHTNNKINALLPTTLSLGNTGMVEVFYDGNPPSGAGFGSFIQSQHGDNVPVLWTLSEPYGAYEWWPCKQDLTDKIDSLDFTITVPEGNKVGSNGLLVESTTQNGKSTYHWKHRYPIPAYLVAFATTNYVEYNDTIPSDNGDIIQLNYVYPESLAAAKQGTHNLIEVMQLFNELFGIYPFWQEKYGHAQFGWGGGMEHTTMTFCVNFNHGLLSHELAHQWFGDDATCGSWEDIWLNEGFATYLEGLTYEHDLGTNTFPNWINGKMNAVKSQPGGSVWVDDTTQVGRIFSGRLSYSKGAMVLHMLRWTVGDDNFFQGVRNYLADANIQYGFARTHQLREHLEATSGMDLTDFFDSWFYGEGFPIYNITWAQGSDNILHVKVDQTQSTGNNFFKMKLPLKVVGAGIDEVVTVQNNSNEQIFDIQLSGPIASLVFDPTQWIVANSTVIKGPVGLTDSNISTQLELAPNPVSDVLHLSVNNLEVQQVEIFDLAGKLILRSKSSFSQIQDIDVSSLQSGGYVLVVGTKNGRGSVSFVKL